MLRHLEINKLLPKLSPLFVATKIEAALLLVYKAGWNFDQGRVEPKWTSMAKMFTGGVAVQVAEEAFRFMEDIGVCQNTGSNDFTATRESLKFMRGQKKSKKIRSPLSWLENLGNQIQFINSRFKDHKPRK